MLNLSSSASENEIAASYRKLAKIWHPDRHKNPADKEKASKKFMEIQEAYEALSKIKARRAEHSKRKPDNY